MYPKIKVAWNLLAVKKVSVNGDSEIDGDIDSNNGDNIYCIQNAQEVKIEKYAEIKNQFGHYNKEYFL